MEEFGLNISYVGEFSSILFSELIKKKEKKKERQWYKKIKRNMFHKKRCTTDPPGILKRLMPSYTDVSNLTIFDLIF